MMNNDVSQKIKVGFSWDIPRFPRGDVHELIISTSSEDRFLDQQPAILEKTIHAKTSEWNQLGVALELDAEDLAGCHDCTRMYQL